MPLQTIRHREYASTPDYTAPLYLLAHNKLFCNCFFLVCGYKILLMFGVLIRFFSCLVVRLHPSKVILSLKLKFGVLGCNLKLIFDHVEDSRKHGLRKVGSLSFSIDLASQAKSHVCEKLFFLNRC